MAAGERPPKGGESEPPGRGRYLWEPGHIRPGIDREQLEEYRRDFQVADWASRLRIPVESLLHETAGTYVGVVRDVGAVLDGLIQQAGADGVAAGSSLHHRFDVTALLLTNAHAILQETFTGGDQLTGRAAPWQLATSLSDAMSRQGWWLSELDDTAQPPVHAAPSGLWRDDGLFVDRSVPPSDVVAWSTWWYWGRPAREQQDPEHLARVRNEAARLGLSAAAARVPATHAALTHLVTIRDLARRTADTNRLPPAPGLDPDAPERFRRIDPLLRLGALMLEEEYRPVPPVAIGQELARFAIPYGLAVHRS